MAPSLQHSNVPFHFSISDQFTILDGFTNIYVITIINIYVSTLFNKYQISFM